MRLSLPERIARRILLLSQHVPVFSARGGYSGLSPGEQGNNLAKSRREFEDSANFLENLKEFNFVDIISGKRILDFGSGYGGRSLWMAQYASEVEGIEIRQELVDASAIYAADLKTSNTRFRTGTESGIDNPDGWFDVVVSFDVLEHVQNPDIVLREMYRVLRPSGAAIIIFTPYYGMFSHHLNYLSLFPALHWAFAPKTLVHATNSLLEDPRFASIGVGKQPEPSLSWNGRGKVLPTLNGLTKQEYSDLLRQIGFKVEYMHSTPILAKFHFLGRPGAMFNELLMRFRGLDEAFAHNLVSILRKSE